MLPKISGDAEEDEYDRPRMNAKQKAQLRAEQMAKDRARGQPIPLSNRLTTSNHSDLRPFICV